MAIYQRDRDFHKIFSEIELNIIPVKCVKELVFYLEDGSQVTMNSNDLDTHDTEKYHVESLIKDLNFQDQMVNLRVRIDYDRVEEQVNTEVNKILNNL